MTRYPPLEKRVWNKVAIGGADECWEWTASKFPNGYGQIRHSPDQYAHRTVWILTYGPIPEGKWVLHRCDNPSCVNPRHLFLGDSTVNVEDMMSKGRNKPASGEHNGKAKLTIAVVREIKRALLRGASDRQLGILYRVTPATIWAIRKGRTWKQINP